jgi:hypothetical protein
MLLAITLAVKVGEGVRKVHHLCESLVFFSLVIKYLIAVCPEVLICEFA